jgi:hypothetical protein
MAELRRLDRTLKFADDTLLLSTAAPVRGSDFALVRG